MFITNCRSDKEKLNYGFILGKGTLIDRNSISFANTLLSFYSSFTEKNINIYNELALSANNRNAVISGLRIKINVYSDAFHRLQEEPGIFKNAVQKREADWN